MSIQVDLNTMSFVLVAAPSLRLDAAPGLRINNRRTGSRNRRLPYGSAQDDRPNTVHGNG